MTTESTTMPTHVPDGSAWISGTEWDMRTREGRTAARRTVANARHVLRGHRRALSVLRPWANLIMVGHKTVENRTWSTGHRGELCLHGGQAWEPSGVALATELGLAGFDTTQNSPRGYLGTVHLIDVHPANGCCTPWGDPGPGIYHWVLAEPHPFPAPIPGRGRLGLYRMSADLLPEQTP